MQDPFASRTIGGVDIDEVYSLPRDVRTCYQDSILRQSQIVRHHCFGPENDYDIQFFARPPGRQVPRVKGVRMREIDMSAIIHANPPKDEPNLEDTFEVPKPRLVTGARDVPQVLRVDPGVDRIILSQPGHRRCVRLYSG